MKQEKTQQLINDFKTVHGDTYDYSLFTATVKKCKSTVICREHGSFEIDYEKHFRRKQGCPKCGRIKMANTLRKTNDQYISECIKVHNGFYDYSLVEYTGAFNHVKIICPVHGQFEQEAKVHLQGSGCSKCANEQAIKPFEEFYNNLSDKFKTDYIFDKDNYKSASEPIDVVCKKHGVFTQVPIRMTRGHGCHKCAYDTTASKARLKPEDIINRANEVHDNKYTYGSLDDYTDNQFMWTIYCPIHGEFKQVVSSHLRGFGCRACAFDSSSSKTESELVEFFESNGLTVISNYRPDWLNGLELDIYVPELNLAVEYNGAAYHHSSDTGLEFYDATKKSDTYHLSKYNSCVKNNINLIHIFDFEDLEIWKEDLMCYINTYPNVSVSFENTERIVDLRKTLQVSVYGVSKINCGFTG